MPVTNVPDPVGDDDFTQLLGGELSTTVETPPQDHRYPDQVPSHYVLTRDDGGDE